MNIAVDISPINSSKENNHKVRGVGKYITLLSDNLEKYDKKNSYTFFSRGNKLKNNIDVIHYPYFEPFFLTLPLFKKTKTVVTVHDLTPLVLTDDFPKGVKGFIKWQIQKFALKNADAIITDSQASKKDIIKIVGVLPHKVSVVYLSAGEEFKIINNSELIIQNLRKKYNLPKRFGLYVGDVTPNKNLPRIVTAIQQVKIPLVMVGRAIVSDFDKKNPWNRDLAAISSKTENNPLFIKTGFVSSSDLTSLYNLAEFLIMPSLYEGFGLPILEAMTCGCPVITTKKGSFTEVAGDAVFYVDAYSTESIAKGIEEVFTNKKLQDELSKKGIIQSKKFTLKKTVNETIRVYKSVL